MIGGTATEPSIDGSFVPVRSPDVVAVDAEGEAVLVDETSDQLHLLNATGALLWACFDGESSVTEICFDLADGLDVPFERVLADTLAVVEDLRAKGLLADAGDERHRQDRHDHDLRVLPDQSGDVPRRPGLLEEPPSG